MNAHTVCARASSVLKAYMTMCVYACVYVGACASKYVCVYAFEKDIYVIQIKTTV